MILIVNNYSDCNVHLGDLQMKEIGEKVKEMTGKEYMIKRYYELSGTFLKENPQIKGVILGGCNCKWDDLYFDIFEGEFELIRAAEVPVLGICAGHHLIAMAYGASVRRVDFGKEERFFTDIEILKDSPLTKGLDKIYAFEYHLCAVIELVDDLERLMTSEKTLIQGFKVKGKEVYGVQFHPELDHETADPLFRARSEEKPSGDRILLNFLALTD